MGREAGYVFRRSKLVRGNSSRSPFTRSSFHVAAVPHAAPISSYRSFRLPYPCACWLFSAWLNICRARLTSCIARCLVGGIEIDRVSLAPDRHGFRSSLANPFENQFADCAPLADQSSAAIWTYHSNQKPQGISIILLLRSKFGDRSCSLTMIRDRNGIIKTIIHQMIVLIKRSSFFLNTFFLSQIQKIQGTVAASWCEFGQQTKLRCTQENVPYIFTEFRNFLNFLVRDHPWPKVGVETW